jgi:proline iminopeptidase
MKKTFRFIIYVFLFCIVAFLFAVFFPRNYDVPQPQERKSTQYWNLSDGSKIAYTLLSAKGEKKSYPIIYLHGGPGGFISDNNIAMLQPLADTGYDVYLYDQVGSGRSSRLENIRDYTVQKHIDNLDEIIKNTGAEKVILIGQSWGGILATLYVADHPDRVDKIILTCPGPIYPYNNELANVKTPDSLHLKEPKFSNADGNKKVNNVRTKTMSFFATTFGKKLASDEEADAFATYLNHELNRSCVCDTSIVLKEEAGNGYYAQLMTYLDLTKIKDPRKKFRKLDTKVLVLKGQCDNQKWGFTNEYLQLFKNSRLTVIPGAGHFIYVEQPALYIKNIQHFLSE